MKCKKEERFNENGDLIYYKNIFGYERWYDEVGNIIHSKDSNGYEQWTDYDKKGKIFHTSSSDGFEVWLDDKENVVRIKYRDGSEKHFNDKREVVYSKDSNDKTNKEAIVKIERNFKGNNCVKEITGKEFKDSGALWFVNQTLHLFGLVITWNPDTDELKPSITKFRGFNEECNDDGYKKLSSYLKDNIIEIEKDCE